MTQTLELINAWDRHYLDMVGQDVKTLCSPINRSGVSPYLSSLLRRHSKWLEKSDHSQVTARHNERKVRNYYRVHGKYIVRFHAGFILLVILRCVINPRT